MSAFKSPKRRRRRRHPSSTPARDRRRARRTWSKRVRDTGIAVHDLLALTHAVYHHIEWRSAKRAAGREQPSWEIVYQIHADVDAFKEFQRTHSGFRVLERDEAAATAIIEWCQEQSVDDLPIEHYRRGLKFATSRDEVSGKNFAITCSAVDAYMRDVVLPAVPVSTCHLGVPGRRQVFERLTFVRSTSRRTRYKTFSYRLHFVDDEGNAVIWFASHSPADLGIAMGERCNVRATVRRHDTFRGSKQTIVTRGRVISSSSTTAAAAA